MPAVESSERSFDVEADEMHLVCFDVGSACVAFDVAHVREVVRSRPTAPLPGAPDPIEGVIELRDALVPVLDLGPVLAEASVDASDSRSRIAIVEWQGLVAGLRVSAASDVLCVRAADVEAPPALVVRAGSEAVRSVLRRKEGPPVLVLSLAQILSRLAPGLDDAPGDGHDDPGAAAPGAAR